MSCNDCSSNRIVKVRTKCDNTLIQYNGVDYVQNTTTIGLGYDESYIEFSYCLDCGKIQNTFPIIEKEVVNQTYTDYSVGDMFIRLLEFANNNDFANVDYVFKQISRYIDSNDIWSINAAILQAFEMKSFNNDFYKTIDWAYPKYKDKYIRIYD